MKSTPPKKFFLITPHFNGNSIGSDKLNFDYARALSNNNKNIVYVLSVAPFYPAWRSAEVPAVERHGSVIVIRMMSIPFKGFFKWFPSRLVLETYAVILVFASFVRFRRAVRSVNEIVFVSPPLLFCFFRGLFGIRTRVVVHDINSVYVRRKFPALAKLAYFTEKFILWRFSKRTYLSESMRDEIECGCSNTGAVNIVYPRADFLPRHSDLDTDNTPIFGYFGALGLKQEAPVLFNLISGLAAQFNGKGLIRTASPIPQSLLEKGGVEVLDPVPRNNLMEELQSVHFHLVVQKQRTESGSIPSKIPNILASGRVLIVLTDNNPELVRLIGGQPGVEFVTFANVSSIPDIVELYLERGLRQLYFNRSCSKLLMPLRYEDVVC